MSKSSEMTKNNRRDRREKLKGKVQLLIASTNGSVADVSARGLRVRIAHRPLRALPDFESILISPADGAIAPFNLSAMKRWNKLNAESVLVGYEIKTFTDNESRERFNLMLSGSRLDPVR
jgi:hypothetical protein